MVNTIPNITNNNTFIIEETDWKEDDIVVQLINKRLDAMHYIAPNGKRYPLVCAVCDQFLLHQSHVKYLNISTMKKFRKVLAWTRYEDNMRPEAIKEYYKFNAETTDCKKDLSFTDGMALSPRTLVIKNKRKQYWCH